MHTQHKGHIEERAILKHKCDGEEILFGRLPFEGVFTLVLYVVEGMCGLVGRPQHCARYTRDKLLLLTSQSPTYRLKLDSSLFQHGVRIRYRSEKERFKG